MASLKATFAASLFATGVLAQSSSMDLLSSVSSVIGSVSDSTSTVLDVTPVLTLATSNTSMSAATNITRTTTVSVPVCTSPHGNNLTTAPGLTPPVPLPSNVTTVSSASTIGVFSPLIIAGTIVAGFFATL